MTPTDFIIIAMVFAGALYGGIRSLRPALFAAVMLFGSLLAAAALTLPLERLILDLSGVGAENFPGAPAVAVLILENHEAGAYLAAFLPSFFVLFLVLFFGAAGAFLGRYFVEPAKGVPSRTAGVLVGLCAGSALALLFIAQLLRLPSPPASRMFRGSLLVSALNHALPDLLPAFSGGL